MGPIKFLYVSLLIVSSFMAAGCAQATSKGTTSDDNTEVEGSWAGPCDPSAGLPGVGSSKESFVFAGNAYNHTLIGYTDTGCATEGVKIVSTGSFTLAEASATTPSGSKDVDFAPSSDIITTKVPSVTTAFNTGGAGSTSICTGVTFVTSTAVSVAGTTCNSIVRPSIGATVVNIYKLDTSVTPNSLRLGDTPSDFGEISPTARPTSYDTTNDTLFSKL
jgi:hypothetical protein